MSDENRMFDDPERIRSARVKIDDILIDLEIITNILDAYPFIFESDQKRRLMDLAARVTSDGDCRSLLNAILGQNDAQKKAGDEYCTLGESWIADIRKVLDRRSDG
jgi:hypothetical protein